LLIRSISLTIFMLHRSSAYWFRPGGQFIMKNRLNIFVSALLLVATASCKSDAASAPMPLAAVTAAVLTTVTTPPPPPQPLANAAPIGLGGESPIASEFDFRDQLEAAGGTGAIPASGIPDVVGAFRFICMPGQISYDDPIIFPGKPGAAHLHQYFGNVKANAFSTYQSLRRGGDLSCMSPANRSAYWMPAMLDGIGNVVRPDFVSIYYKRRPASDPKCDPAKDQRAEGLCIDLPNGLNFVFGYDWVNPANSPTGAYYFNCDGPTAVPGHYSDIETALAKCPLGNRLGAVINAPTCWNGKTLNAADGRSHVGYASYGSWGYLRCPESHPYVIPAFTMGAWYTVDANLKTWHLSSDMMNPGGKRGATFHADFMMAWDPEVKKLWHSNCIDKLLNCSGGVLGDGRQMKQSWPASWYASPRLVPVPQS